MQKYNWNYPTTMWVGENRINDIGSACKTLNIMKPLLVTDKGLSKSDIVSKTLSILKSEGISAELYSNVVGNPTGTNVNEGKKILADSDLKILAATDLNDAAKKIVEAIK